MITPHHTRLTQQRLLARSDLPSEPQVAALFGIYGALDDKIRRCNRMLRALPVQERCPIPSSLLAVGNCDVGG